MPRSRLRSHLRQMAAVPPQSRKTRLPSRGRVDAGVFFSHVHSKIRVAILLSSTMAAYVQELHGLLQQANVPDTLAVKAVSMR